MKRARRPKTNGRCKDALEWPRRTSRPYGRPKIPKPQVMLAMKWHYARNHKVCRHNLSYWTAQPYRAWHGAASMLTREGYDKLCTIQTSLPQPQKTHFGLDSRYATPGNQLQPERHLRTSFDVEFLDVCEPRLKTLCSEPALRGTVTVFGSIYTEVLGKKERVEGTLESCVRWSSRQNRSRCFGTHGVRLAFGQRTLWTSLDLH